MPRSEKPHRCTLQDIAERTGFTVNTVSRALKDKSDISIATREQIKAVADEICGSNMEDGEARWMEENILR